MGQRYKSGLWFWAALLTRASCHSPTVFVSLFVLVSLLPLFLNCPTRPPHSILGAHVHTHTESLSHAVGHHGWRKRQAVGVGQQSPVSQLARQGLNNEPAPPVPHTEVADCRVFLWRVQPAQLGPLLAWTVPLLYLWGKGDSFSFGSSHHLSASPVSGQGDHRCYSLAMCCQLIGKL